MTARAATHVAGGLPASSQQLSPLSTDPATAPAMGTARQQVRIAARPEGRGENASRAMLPDRNRRRRRQELHQKVIQAPVRAGAHGIERRPEQESRGVGLAAVGKPLRVGGCEPDRAFTPQVGQNQHAKTTRQHRRNAAGETGLAW